MSSFVPVPTGRAALVLAAASTVPLLFGAGSLLVVNALVLLVALGDWTMAPRSRHFTIEREFPRAVALDVDATLGWTIHNHTTRSVHVAVADELAPSLRAGSRRFGGRVPARGTLTAETSIRPARRGRFTPSELVWRTTGPLGLLARQGTIRQAEDLRVYPHFRSRAEAELRIDRARILEVGLRSTKGRGGGTDFDQLREYTVDDESRRIDWAATARAGRPIVRTYRAERNQNVVVLYDNGRVMAGRVEGVPRAEFAMDAAMLLTTVATRLGDRCGLMAFDAEVRATVQPSQSRDQLGRVTESLYALQPSLVDSDYLGAFRAAAATFRKRALIVILTDLVEQAVGDALLPALPVLGQSHLVIVGAIADPKVARWADEAPEDDEAAYRQAAAARTLRARARAAAKLRAAGVTVVDVAPQNLASELGDAYLEVKASGRL